MSITLTCLKTKEMSQVLKPRLIAESCGDCGRSGPKSKRISPHMGTCGTCGRDPVDKFPLCGICKGVKQIQVNGSWGACPACCLDVVHAITAIRPLLVNLRNLDGSDDDRRRRETLIQELIAPLPGIVTKLFKLRDDEDEAKTL